MASIRHEAQKVLQEAREGIAWIAVWKEGRGWKTAPFWAEVEDEGTCLTFEKCDTEKIREILHTDPNAIIVNSYYDNLGDIDTMTRDNLANAMRWQYNSRHARLIDKVAYKEGWLWVA